MINDFVKFSYGSIKSRKLRSLLTVTGIIIGIAAIISLIAVSQGLENYIGAQFEQLGSSRIFVLPKSEGFTFSEEWLTTKDVETLEKMGQLDWVSGWLMISDEITYGKEKGFVQMMHGISTKDTKKRLEDFGLVMEKGRFFIEHEKGVAFIGSRMSSNFFDKEILLNNNIEIKGKKFKVIGILKEVGNQDDDTTIYLPLEETRDLYNKPDEVNFIEVKVKSGLNIQEVAKVMQRNLERARDDDAFDVMTPDQILNNLNTVLSVLQVVLVSIASIALIVGGVGIMNSTYTSVLERTRDIGVMKAIGAKKNHIIQIFLLEAAIMGLTGGILGCILGFSLAKIIEILAKAQGYGILKVEITLGLLGFGMGFAILVAMLSAFLPAYKAANLKPVEALQK